MKIKNMTGKIQGIGTVTLMPKGAAGDTAEVSERTVKASMVQHLLNAGLLMDASTAASEAPAAETGASTAAEPSCKSRKSDK